MDTPSFDVSQTKQEMGHEHDCVLLKNGLDCVGKEPELAHVHLSKSTASTKIEAVETKDLCFTKEHSFLGSLWAVDDVSVMCQCFVVCCWCKSHFTWACCVDCVPCATNSNVQLEQPTRDDVCLFCPVDEAHLSKLSEHR